MSSAEELRALFEAKARAELERADQAVPGASDVVWSGDPLGRTFLVKGSPGKADRGEGRALAGEDGAAIRKALEALDIEPHSVFATCARPGGDGPSEGSRLRLRSQIEAVDPARVIALDPEAAADVTAALGAGPLRFGEPAEHRGRTLLAVDGLEASLSDETRKKAVWSQLKALSR